MTKGASKEPQRIVHTETRQTEEGPSARTMLHGAPAKLKNQTATRIHDVLSRYTDYFRQKDRKTLANSIAEITTDAKSSTDETLIKNTVKKAVEQAIDWSKFAIPLAEKDSIVNQVVTAAIQ